MGPPRSSRQPDDTAGDSWAVPWSILDVVGVLVATVAVTYVAAVAIGLLAATMDLPDELVRVLVPLPLVVLSIVTLVWVRVRHHAVRRLAGPAPARGRAFLVGLGWGVGGFLAVNVVLGAVVQIATELADADLPRPQEQLHEAAADPALAPWLVLSAVVVAPLAEELFFRGMLFQALRRHLGRWASIIVSGVVFGAAHVLAELTWSAGMLIFWLILPLGMLLAWLFDRYGSLVTPIAVHVVFNLATVSVMLVL